MHPYFFSNYNTENHSKQYQVHYNPQYIPLEDQFPIVRSLFQQQKQFTNDHNHQASLIVPHENSNLKNLNVQYSNMKKPNNNSDVVLEDKCIPSKRSSKKDRHSKIDTARGPRDRRMRLSLDVAKKFFRLQDMLGFDKASNTIQWLIMKSKPAIRDLISQHSNQSCSLIGVLNSASSGSECEVLSGIIDDQYSLDKTGDQDQLSVIDNAKSTSCKEKKKVDRRARKSVYIDHTLAKETRVKARARARKRTSEKGNINFGSDGGSCDQYTRLIRPSLDKVIDQNTNRLGSWIPFGENQVYTTDQPEYPSSHIQFKQGIAGENSSVMSNNWMPSLFNYHNNPGSSHEHQFSDFQIQGKPWAGIHN